MRHVDSRAVSGLSITIMVGSGRAVRGSPLCCIELRPEPAEEALCRAGGASSRVTAAPGVAQGARRLRLRVCACSSCFSRSSIRRSAAWRVLVRLGDSPRRIVERGGGIPGHLCRIAHVLLRRLHVAPPPCRSRGLALPRSGRGVTRPGMPPSLRSRASASSSRSRAPAPSLRPLPRGRPVAPPSPRSGRIRAPLPAGRIRAPLPHPGRVLSLPHRRRVLTLRRGSVRTPVLVRRLRLFPHRRAIRRRIGVPPPSPLRGRGGNGHGIGYVDAAKTGVPEAVVSRPERTASAAPDRRARLPASPRPHARPGRCPPCPP